MSASPILFANWKMHKTSAEAQAWVRTVAPALVSGVQVGVFPPYLSLPAAYAAAAGAPLSWGAQDVGWEEEGPFTGLVSPEMLVDAGCTLALVAHSERRHWFSEDDAMAARKIKGALRAGLTPVYCLGETAEEKAGGHTAATLLRQFETGLQGLSGAGARRVMFAYEPVWAIGTGRPARQEDIADAASAIREGLTRMFGKGLAQEAKLLYGGSVQAENLGDILSISGIDGALVGSACLDAREFIHMMEVAAS